MTTLKNTFHNTEAKTQLCEQELDRIRNKHPYFWTVTERALVNRLRRKLCGIAGCTCGGVFGEREA